jgi:DNA-binding NarL/FixJ family response regulator
MTLEQEKDTAVHLINLLIVDDHQMVRDGIKVMLQSKKDIFQFIIDEAENGEEAIKKVLRKPYDVILMDYQMPDMSGAQTAENIMKYQPRTKILALSNYDELAYVEKMIASGSKGYVLKNIEPTQLLTAIKTILENKTYYSNEVSSKLLDAANRTVADQILETHGLTKRELEVLRMIAMEMTNEEIAEKLFVGKRTVDTHRQNLLNKLHARNTVGLIKAAYKLELVK